MRAKKNFFFLAWLAAAALACPIASQADEASVKSMLVKKYKSLPSALVVRKLDVGGLYEVNMLGQEAYTNEKVDFLLVGGSLLSLTDASNLYDVTASRKPAFLRDFFQSLPIDKAIKTVYGDGKNVLVSFEDPDCPLCAAQHQEWSKNPAAFNATVYTFMFPLTIHPDAKSKAEFLLCQKDVPAAWRMWMEQRKGVPLDAKGALDTKGWTGCAEGKQRLHDGESLARSMGYHETPRFIFANGLGASSVLTTAQFADAFKTVDESLLKMAPKDGAAKGVADKPLLKK